VVHLVALDRRGERDRVRLVHELRGVHADDHEDVAVLLLERAQLVEDVQAVDAAERPEVEDHDLAAELREGHVAAAGVEPAAAGELRGADSGKAGGALRHGPSEPDAETVRGTRPRSDSSR
jgi:hypothetical protein